MNKNLKSLFHRNTNPFTRIGLDPQHQDFALCRPPTGRFILIKSVANCTNKSPGGRGHAVGDLMKLAPWCLATYFNSVCYVAGEMLVFILN